MMKNKLRTAIDKLATAYPGELEVKYGTPLLMVSADDGSMIDTEKVTSGLADLLSKEILYYKNESLPRLKRFVEAVTNTSNVRLHEKARSLPEVVLLQIPEFVMEENDMGKYVTQHSVPLPMISVVMPDTSEELLRNTFVAGNKSTKAVRDEFIGSVPMTTLIRVWNDYIMNMSTSNNKISDLGRVTTMTNSNKDDIYILKILLDNLVDEIPDGVVGTIAEYNNCIVALDIYVKNALNLLLTRYEKFTAESSVVCSVNEKSFTYADSEYTIILHNENTKILTSNDVTMDSIVGAALKVGDVVNMDLIKEHKQSFMDYTASKLAIMRSQDDDDAYVMLKKIYVTEFTAALEDFDAPESTYVTDDLILKAVVDYIESLSIAELKSIQTVCYDIFSKIVYNKSNLGYFLARVNHYAPENHPMDVVLVLVIQDILVKYVATMIEVEDTGD